MRIEPPSLAAAVLAWMLPFASLAEDVSPAQVADLERRVEELEQLDEDPLAGHILAEWAKHVSVGGSANTGWYDGEQDSPLHSANFQVWDARFFVDAELGDDVRIGDTSVLRNVGFTFEWDLVRLGRLQNRVGELYTDFQGIGESGWANLQVGRFQLPVGEGYLIFSRGYGDQLFITNPVGAPWYWDEGVRFYGSDPHSSFGYVASISDGENAFNVDENDDYQYTLKLYANPMEHLHLSVSGVYTGRIGSSSSSANGSLWLGETWARAFGSGSSVANYVDGGIVPDGPSRIESTHLLGADVVVTFPDQVRVWLAYGTWGIDQKGGTYDRRMHYWVGEVLLFGGLVTPELKDVYAGFRAHGFGTYDSGEGYLLDFRHGGSLGYNMESMNAYSAVVGWKLLRFVSVRAEYTHQDIEVVRGVSSAIRRAANDVDSWAIEIGVHF